MNAQFDRILATMRDEYGMPGEQLTPYQYRFDDRLDIYPVNKKWHDIETQKRGTYKNLLLFLLHHLGLVLATQCPKCRHNFFRRLS